ncbi:membrane-bound O-acyltransferase family protein [Sulfitobacter sp. SK012]|uniref:MBOAT family O-acyltransferase n=1 Tax=Sulfitobacter sp. SK012 TaxID=1389005 RepID=UPI000E0A2C1C|nr:MBOAT family protein [Sulfitobacter sp. SK012]AXI48650.1 membrane-bound O-acyltransferase family protein [Sulfitobacter sp. SK012]
MIFSSSIFIFGFLPLFLTVYYAAPKSARSVVILIGSYAFYGWWRLDYLAVVFGMSVISYLAAYVAYTATTTTIKTWAVRLGVAFDLAVLGYFKYTMFAMSGLSDLSVALGGADITVPAIILPIGISFHTFQSISYIIDVSRKDAPPARNLIDFLAFGSLFPQLIAGPVLRYKDLADQFANRTHTPAKFVQGISRFAQGLAMKLLIADNVAPLADRIFALSNPTGTESWLGASAYSIQLLFDFAGYSSMAIGLGLMIGFQFVENFNAPYISQSITEFWRRWHISLSMWLRDYLYLPLGGNRRGAARTYINLAMTMLLGGLWHGANWTFILWGAWHGIWLAFERALGAKSKTQVWPALIAWPLTMTLVMIGWVMFRAASVTEAFNMYAGMIGLNGWSLSASMAWQIQPTEIVALLLGSVISVFGQRLAGMTTDTPAALQLTSTFALMVMACMALLAQTHSPFLYFQF